MRIISRFLIAIFAIAITPNLVLADAAIQCVKGRGPAAINGCTQIIKTGKINGKKANAKTLTAARLNRGFAYLSIGANKLALTDYNMAVKLSPKTTISVSKARRLLALTA